MAAGAEGSMVRGDQPCAREPQGQEARLRRLALTKRITTADVLASFLFSHATNSFCPACAPLHRRS